MGGPGSGPRPGQRNRLGTGKGSHQKLTVRGKRRGKAIVGKTSKLTRALGMKTEVLSHSRMPKLGYKGSHANKIFARESAHSTKRYTRSKKGRSYHKGR